MKKFKCYFDNNGYNLLAPMPINLNTSYVLISIIQANACGHYLARSEPINKFPIYLSLFSRIQNGPKKLCDVSH